jgi:hypothetical protein
VIAAAIEGAAGVLGVPASVLTVGGLLGLAVLLVLTGRLVPRRTLVDKIAEAERWREAYEHAEEARAEQAEQIGELVELARTTHAAIASLPRRRSDDVAT